MPVVNGYFKSRVRIENALWRGRSSEKPELVAFSMGFTVPVQYGILIPLSIIQCDCDQSTLSPGFTVVKQCSCCVTRFGSRRQMRDATVTSFALLHLFGVGYGQTKLWNSTTFKLVLFWNLSFVDFTVYIRIYYSDHLWPWPLSRLLVDI